MKVVINRCFGGFGLSDEAFEKLLARKGIEFEKEETDSKLMGANYYKKGMLGNNDGYLGESDFTTDRSDSDLISVVEELGEKANGWAAELAIVEIPDDVKWHIHEYDGIEHVAEDHRTWWR